MAKVTQFIPPLIIAGKGARCGVCNKNLQGHACQLQDDGNLWCLVCIGNRAALPADVVETLKQMEREHGKR